MPSTYQFNPYDPCPCGSGKKYKFCCAEKAKANRHGRYPIGTIAYYGPDDKAVTKIAAGVLLNDGAEAIMERWSSPTVLGDPEVDRQIKQFFARHGVKNVVNAGAIIGCPHEEGKDFPAGQECPFCPFWIGKQGIVVRPEDDDEDEEFEGDEIIASDDDDDFEEDESDDDSEDPDLQIERMEAVAGETADRHTAVDNALTHLRANLQLPCEVTGIEDFRWEEPYVLGGSDPQEYKRLKQTQPSYRDRYELLSLSKDGDSEWMLFRGEDISAHVRRTSDGKEFVLGLCELKATDRISRNFKLLDDYSVWFVNTR